MDGETVAGEMRRLIGPDGNRLFRVSKFLTPQQVSSFFSRLAAKFRHNVVLDDDIRASQEKTNFYAARQDILSHLHLKHPINLRPVRHLCLGEERDTEKPETWLALVTM